MRVRKEPVEEHGEHSSVAGCRWREDALQAELVSRVPDLLGLRYGVGDKARRRYSEGLDRGWLAEIEDRGERDLVGVHASWQEVPRRAALPFGQTVELANRRLTIECQIQRRETLGRIPAAAECASPEPESGLRSGARCRNAFPRYADGSTASILAEEMLVDHPRLDEDALGHGVYRTEHTPKLPGAEQVDRLVIVKGPVGSEQPVVRRFGLKDTGQPLKDCYQLEQALTGVRSRCGLP